MFRRVLIVSLLMLVIISGAFAGNLLRRSILSCSHDELVAMCLAYGLDSTLSDQEMKERLLDYFDAVEDEEAVPGAAVPAPAEDVATSIGISHADRLYSNDNIIILSGNVGLTFTTKDGTRSLTADTVAVDLNSKILEASGSVKLGGSTDKDRVFTGEVVSLDWSSLDVVVYEGTSSTTRSNSSGRSIVFYVSGETVSYAGPTSGIFFRNGTIATTENDPYWSISSDKLSLSETDMFVDRAVFRLGRVPVFYFPIFFYPGTTLSFNPSIGLSSDRGAFLTTTYELYGKYPKLGMKGSKSKSNSSQGSEDTDYSGAITAFLQVDENTEMIRDGFYYRPLKSDEQLSPLEQWARSTGSYFAVFGDVYEKLGLVAGIDTMNYLLDKSLSIGATGAVGYYVNQLPTLPKFRFTFDFNLNYKLGSLNVNAKLPLLSDPYVRSDFLNRNTSFSLDALLGSEQFFPTSFSNQTTYTWLLNASYNTRAGDYSFNISSLKADIDYKLISEKDKLGNTIYKSKIVEGSLPYLSLSSNGTFFSLQGKSLQTTRSIGYTNDLAQQFADEMASVETPESEGQTETTFQPYGGPDLRLEETTVSEAGSIRAGYTFSQTLDNIHKEDLAYDNFYTKANGSIYLNADAPGQWFTLSETLKPQFNFSNSVGGTQVDEFYLSSELRAGVPKAGVTYTLSQKVYNHYNKVTPTVTDTTDRWGEWNKTDVTAHNLSFSKKISSFTLGFYFQLKPLVEVIRPSLGYSRGGFSASADFSMKRPPESERFRKDVLNFNLAYSDGRTSVSFSNKYDFTLVEDESVSRWKGYSLVQKLSFKPLDGLTLSQSSTFKGKFEPNKLQLSASYVLDTDVMDLSTSTSMSFKDRNFQKENLNLSVRLSQEKITFWKGRIGFDSSLRMAFNYDFENPYRTSFTIDLTFGFAIAEFLDLAVGVSSANKTFARYYENGSFSLKSMLDDLFRSFDFFGEGRRNTGFNLNSFKVQLVHYMRDWNLYVDAQGSLTTKYSNKYEWVPTVTVYVKWNAIPELTTQGYWDGVSDVWT